jgi:hypothetical protein
MAKVRLNVPEKDRLDAGPVKHVAEFLHHNHMARLGIGNTMRVAHAVNKLRFRRQDAYRRDQYRNHFAELLRENGPMTGSPIEMRDGYAIDTSGSLPYLDDVLREADEIIAERAGVSTMPTGAYRSFFQDMWTPGDAERYPSFLNFATSSPLLAVICDYLRSIPVMSTTLPTGVRLVESNAEYDDRPDEPKDSQLFHIDYYSKPNVYVLVLLRDTTPENGPWSFLPASVTERVKAGSDYWKRGTPYRLSDAQVYSVADRDDLIEFCYPRGTVLFIESSGCLHYGSRNSVKPRFQLMYGYSSICRTDFSELFMKSGDFTPKGSDPRLRRMILDKKYLGEGR